MKAEHSQWECSSVGIEWLLSVWNCGSELVFRHSRALLASELVVLIVQSELSVFLKGFILFPIYLFVIQQEHDDLSLLFSLSLSLPLQALMENSNLNFVKPAWIYAINERQKMLPYQPYSVVPWTIHCIVIQRGVQTHFTSWQRNNRESHRYVFLFVSFRFTTSVRRRSNNQIILCWLLTWYSWNVFIPRCFHYRCSHLLAKIEKNVYLNGVC